MPKKKPKKMPPKVITVADEVKNRECRNGLRGVHVAIDGKGPSIAIAHSYWEDPEKLIVVLEGERAFRPERLHLRSKWPVHCCRPRFKNEWNSNGSKPGFFKKKDDYRPPPPGFTPYLITTRMSDIEAKPRAKVEE